MDLLTRRSYDSDMTLQSLQMAIIKYFPLLEDREIRFVDVQPGQFSDVLSVRLYHDVLGHTASRPFEALSYVWGCATESVRIHVEVVSLNSTLHSDYFPVGQNLATALQHLRHVDAPRTLWVDALCINQADYVERGKQILRMGDIYRLARRVIAFLGPEQDGTDVGFQLLHRIGDGVAVDFNSGIVTPSSCNSTEPELADLHRKLVLDQQELLSVNHIIRHEWFERLWIRQEIGLGGHDGVLQCGHRQIQWQLFCKSIFVLFRKPLVADGFNAVQWRTFRERLGLADTVALFSKRSFSFANLRRQLRTSKCSDPRDRIYGVLGQLRDLGHIDILPDYTKSVAQIYTDVTRKYITEHPKKLLILGQCEMRTLGPFLDIPSWVPDWSSGLSSSQIHAVLPSLFDLLPAVSTVSNQLLQAYGLCCGSVSRVFHAYEGASDAGSTEITDALQELLLQVESDSMLQNGYESRERVLDAYTRTIWVDNFGDRWLPNVPHEPFYQDCVSLVRALVESKPRNGSLYQQNDYTLHLSRAHDACRGRALFATRDGHVGLAPASVAERDEICLLFGCPKPIVLRPVAAGPGCTKLRYEVVGECYLDHMMLGQALLGELPGYLRGAFNTQSMGGMLDAGFIDTRTNTAIQEDPRIEPFLAGLVNKGLLTTPLIEELGKRDVAKILVYEAPRQACEEGAESEKLKNLKNCCFKIRRRIRFLNLLRFVI
ncbi:HET-domain-containing protein [Nemania serpens]|nr:HET-domain-containing protein [Nemania serpens]